MRKIINKIDTYISGKTVKQRVCLAIVSALILLLAFSSVITAVTKSSVSEQTTSQSQTADGTTETSEAQIPAKEPEFRISIIDIGVLLAAIGAYSLHKYREKKQERRK